MKLWREGGMWKLRDGQSTYWHPRLRDVLGYAWRAWRLGRRPTV